MSTTPVAIVTGAARGIGKAIAYKLGRQGARVIAVDNNVRAGETAASALRSEGLDVIFRETDVGIATDVQRLIRWVEGEYQQLNWIVNNAGISVMTPIDEMEVSAFERIIDVNLKSAFLFAKYSAHLLRQSSNAGIVNISSTRAFMSEPANEAYAAAKAGLLGLTHALANSLAPLIRVNAVCPGWIDVRETGEPLRPIDHQQHLVGRVGLPEDVANLTAFLLSSEASFITGQAYIIDGGMTKKMIYEE